jgi:hypothetical protein
MNGYCPPNVKEVAGEVVNGMWRKDSGILSGFPLCNVSGRHTVNREFVSPISCLLFVEHNPSGLQ